MNYTFKALIAYACFIISQLSSKFQSPLKLSNKYFYIQAHGLKIYFDIDLRQSLRMSGSLLYYHMRIAREGIKRQHQECLSCSTIATIFKASGKRFGTERIRLQMRKQGIRISKKRVIRLMKQMGLYSADLDVSDYCSSETNDLEDTQDVQILR